MKKTYALVLLVAGFLIWQHGHDILRGSDRATHDTMETREQQDVQREKEEPSSKAHTYPDFYRGIYLNVVSSSNMEKLKGFVELAKRSHINAFVMDVQSSRYQKSVVPAENIEYCHNNGIHTIARVVMFPDGLRYYPISQQIIEKRLDVVESAAKAGFKEIQFDYIRFNDSDSTRHVPLQKKYEFIQNIMRQARERLKPYDVKIAVDVFGRIPLNQNDIIGQKMEVFDEVVDIISPMAYPSHYWNNRLKYDPYYTVKWTSSEAKKRAKKAEIVTWIQAFQMHLGTVPYKKYVREQIRAVHDAEIKGFIMWNARQQYAVPLQAARDYYASQGTIAENEPR